MADDVKFDGGSDGDRTQILNVLDTYRSRGVRCPRGLPALWQPARSGSVAACSIPSLAIRRHGKVNEHNTWVPRDHWPEPREHQAIVDFARAHPREGYRRLTLMMLDQDVVAVSPASVYRVLSKAGLLQPWNATARHTDVSYLNICGTFYYLCSVLRAGWVQPREPALGDPWVDDRAGGRAGAAEGQGALCARRRR